MSTIRRPAPRPAPVLAESLWLPDGARLDLRIDAAAMAGGAPEFVLACLRGGRVVLRYAGHAAAASRSLDGREQPYAFRSVEQLRYDFERDLAALADADGDDA